MAGGTMRDGAQTATKGIIFKDMIFWVAQRVPNRRQKDAQVLIADHQRDDAPLGSISWKYVADSVDNGFAQLTDRYCILRPADLRTTGRKKLTRSAFTHAEDAALANWILSEPGDRAGNEIYKTFAESHPTHPWQSWRSRYVKVLDSYPVEKLKQLAMSAADLALQPARRIQQDPKQACSKSTSGTAEKQVCAASAGGQTPPPSHPPPPAAQLTSPRSHSSISPCGSEELGVETQVNMRDRFYHDLAIFVEESGTPVNPDPEVGGKRLELWDLSQAIASQNVPPEEVNWQKVAEDLQYDWRQDTNSVDELRSCFEENLANFFEAIASYVSEDEDAQQQQQQRKTGSPSYLQSPVEVYQSSPPVEPLARKRYLEDDSSSLNENSSKRRCLNRPSEIPATPEERLGVSSTRSPTLLKSQQQQKQQEDQDGDEYEYEDEDEDEDDDEGGEEEGGEQTPISRSRVTSGGKRSRTNKKDDVMSEEFLPELYGDSTSSSETPQSDIDETPSRQLRYEASDVEPITLNLGLSRSVGRPQQSNHREPLQQQQPSATGKKTTSRFARRSLPASFNTNSQRFTAQQAETRSQQPSRPVQEEPDEAEQSQSLQECVDYYEGLGYSRPIVMESLNRASLRPGWPATFLMERLKNNEKIPSNVEGIWTDRDDQSLRFADHVRARWQGATQREKDKAKKELDRLIKKHTEEDVDLRRRFFLAQARMG
ncbi:hypothetical protein E4U21_002584 [Claviceps maximensis]|nr:hypothetical protein E4U21_002584 [Claviceps maximensis]